jgi:hypothetical protein
MARSFLVVNLSVLDTGHSLIFCRPNGRPAGLGDVDGLALGDSDGGVIVRPEGRVTVADGIWFGVLEVGECVLEGVSTCIIWAGAVKG